MIILSNQLSPFYEFYAVRSISFERIALILLHVRIVTVRESIRVVRRLSLVVPLGEGRIGIMLLGSSPDLVY